MSDERFSDFDNFFYYGEGDLTDEIKSDMLAVLTQPKRSLLYSRSRNTAGLSANQPNGIGTRVLMPFNIVTALSKRNLTTGNGQDGTKERRVAISQDQIEIKNKGSNMDVSVFFIPFFDIKQSNKVSFQPGMNYKG